MADSRYVTAYEHRSLQVGEHPNTETLTSGEATLLDRLGEQRPAFVKRGHQSIRLTQYCGVVSLGRRILEILPKVDDAAPPEDCRSLMLRLLRQSMTSPLFTHLSAGQNLRRAPLLEIFIAAFFDSTATIVRGGLLRQYQEHEDDLFVMRGRVNSSRQFTVHINRPDRIACRYDDLTADNIFNRLLKAGLRAVRPWIKSADLNRRWVELMAVFAEVGDSGADSRGLKRLVFDRQAVRYRTSIEWVRWILNLLSPALRAGESSAPALLFDMNVLFQSAIAAILRRQAPQGLELYAQESSRHLATILDAGKQAFSLRPDLIASRGGKILAIGDTKWKRVGVSSSGHLMPDEADMYQMHAYAVSYGCNDLALIYPWHAGLAGSKDTTFVLPGVGSLRPRISVLCIDLSSDPFSAIRGDSASRFGMLLGRISTDVSAPVMAAFTG
jgi:5-methylcytosine-specific restriction enzyme subunit McrC